mgnify:CR=1 FL=1
MLSHEYYSHYIKYEQQFGAVRRGCACEYCGYAARPSSSGDSCSYCFRYKKAGRKALLKTGGKLTKPQNRMAI